MCLPVSCLFWVSSLAYLNLLGTKGYVVVVVVVVVVIQTTQQTELQQHYDTNKTTSALG
jgi:ABC-type siderophore export system fused ATPase/permease subunit